MHEEMPERRSYEKVETKIWEERLLASATALKDQDCEGERDGLEWESGRDG